MTKEIPPSVASPTFTCPHCQRITQQQWGTRVVALDGQGIRIGEVPNHRMAICVVCNEPSIWKLTNTKEGTWSMVYPSARMGEPSTDDMPQKARELYDEARSVSGYSPRAACALLRVALDHLTIEIGAQGNDLNARIGNLVGKGLPELVQQALDTTRVCGNEAVHPEKMVMADTPDQARMLFWILHYVTDVMIRGKREVERLFGSIDHKKRAGIASRDKTNP